MAFIRYFLDLKTQETFKTTHATDYTNKTREINDRQKPRQDPKDHLWFLSFDDSAKFLEREK